MMTNSDVGASWVCSVTTLEECLIVTLEVFCVLTECSWLSKALGIAWGTQSLKALGDAGENSAQTGSLVKLGCSVA